MPIAEPSMVDSQIVERVDRPLRKLAVRRGLDECLND